MSQSMSLLVHVCGCGGRLLLSTQMFRLPAGRTDGSHQDVLLMRGNQAKATGAIALHKFALAVNGVHDVTLMATASNSPHTVDTRAQSTPAALPCN